MLLHIPAREKPGRWLGGVLEPQRHVLEFSGERELQRALERAAGDENFAVMAAAARAHIAARHTWEARLRDLAAAIASG
jgi:hypothetical protein